MVPKKLDNILFPGTFNKILFQMVCMRDIELGEMFVLLGFLIYMRRIEERYETMSSTGLFVFPIFFSLSQNRFFTHEQGIAEQKGNCVPLKKSASL